MHETKIIKYIIAIVSQVLMHQVYCQPVKLEKIYNVFVNENLLFNLCVPNYFNKNFLEIYPVIEEENGNDTFSTINHDVEYNELNFIEKMLYKNKLPTETEKINYLYYHMQLTHKNSSLIIEFKSSSDCKSVIFYYKDKIYYSIFDKPLNLFIFSPHEDPKYISFKNRTEASYADRNSCKLSILATLGFAEFNNNEIENTENSDDCSIKRTKSMPNIYTSMESHDTKLKLDGILNRYSLTLKPKKRLLAPTRIFDKTIKIINLSSNTSSKTTTDIFNFLFSPEFLKLLENIKDSYIINNKTSFTKVLINNPLFPVFYNQDGNKSFPLFTNIYALYITCNSVNQDDLGYIFTLYKNIPVQYTAYSYKALDHSLDKNSFSLKDAIRNQFIEIDVDNDGYIKYTRINEEDSIIEFIAEIKK